MIRYRIKKRVLVVSVFLEVTLKAYLRVAFPRGLSKLFLKISSDEGSDFAQRSAPVPGCSDGEGAFLDFRQVSLYLTPSF